MNQPAAPPVVRSLRSEVLSMKLIGSVPVTAGGRGRCAGVPPMDGLCTAPGAQAEVHSSRCGCALHRRSGVQHRPKFAQEI
jgi:hypothetical protein